MTTGRPSKSLPAEEQARPKPLPDPPRNRDMQQHKHITRVDQALETWFHGRRQGVLVNGSGYLCRDRSEARNSPYPDCVVAFDVDPEWITESNGYIINEVGKPPEFVLEVASETTGKRDEGVKRTAYAVRGVGEYWRFDHTGGSYHSTALAGDRLLDGNYVPITIHREPDGVIWGYSPALELSLCWVDHELRLYDPVEAVYLPIQTELKAQRDAAEARATAVEDQRNAAELRATDAEARAAEARQEAEQLREQLRRLQTDG